MSNLNDLVDDFADKWGPNGPARYQLFVRELRALLEKYGIHREIARRAARIPKPPDTEHEHGDAA
jgi:hypothetical protein